MLSKKFAFFAVICALFALFSLNCETDARYLPTRANTDKLDKLREMYRELLENEIEKEEYQADAPPRWHPESKLFYKREAPSLPAKH